MGKAAQNIVGYGLALPTGGLSLGLTTKGQRYLKGETPKVDVSESTDLINGESQKNKNARLKLLMTNGGILGQEVSSVENTGRNLLGN